MALERYYAAQAAADNGPGNPSFTPPTEPKWYRFQRTNLRNVKDSLLETMPYFAKSPSNTWITWLSDNLDLTNDQNYTVFPRWTNITDLLVLIGRPTNYLTYTPWTRLCGSPTPESDGWENANTQSGGTNFPAGRTKWTTMDYGWQGVHDMAEHLIETPMLNRFKEYGWLNYSAYGGTWDSQGDLCHHFSTNSGSAYTNTWPAAKTLAENAFGGLTDPYNGAVMASAWGPHTVARGTLGSSTNYAASLYTRYAYWRMYIAGDTNGPSFTFDLFMYDDSDLPYPLDEAEDYIHDYNGVTNLSKDAWAQMTDTNIYDCGMGYVWSEPIGNDTNYVPTWCNAPTNTDDATEDSIRGFHMFGGRSQGYSPAQQRGDLVLPMLYWTGHTNGFSYY